MSKKHIIEIALLVATVLFAVTKAIAENENAAELITLNDPENDYDNPS